MISETTGGAHALLTHSSKLSRVLLGSKGSVYSTARRSRRQACGVGSRARPSRKSSRRPASMGSPRSASGPESRFSSPALLWPPHTRTHSAGRLCSRRPVKNLALVFAPPHLVRSRRSLTERRFPGAEGAVCALRSRTESVATAATRTLKVEHRTGANQTPGFGRACSRFGPEPLYPEAPMHLGRIEVYGSPYLWRTASAFARASPPVSTPCPGRAGTGAS